LAWLRKHLREDLAVISMAALFTLEHGSFAVAPYAFLLVTMGYVKLRTGSILNTFAMHFLNNLFLLANRPQTLRAFLMQNEQERRFGEPQWP
jgi:membrane protease YdiL (CAAX protease family)